MDQIWEWLSQALWLGISHQCTHWPEYSYVKAPLGNNLLSRSLMRQWAGLRLVHRTAHITGGSFPSQQGRGGAEMEATVYL